MKSGKGGGERDYGEKKELWAGCSGCLSDPNQKNQVYFSHFHLPKIHLRGASKTASHQSGNQDFEGFLQNCQLRHNRNIHTPTCSDDGREEETTILFSR